MKLLCLSLQREEKKNKREHGEEGEEEEDGRGEMQLIFTEQTSRVGFSGNGSLALFFPVSTSLCLLSPGGQCVPGVRQGTEVIG